MVTPNSTRGLSVAPRPSASSFRYGSDDEGEDASRRPFQAPTSPAIGAAEAQSIYIMREVAAEFERPALLFSGGKDPIVTLHLAPRPSSRRRRPFRCSTHTGRNFPEVLDFRDRTAEGLGLRLVVGSVQDDWMPAHRRGIGTPGGRNKLADADVAAHHP